MLTPIIFCVQLCTYALFFAVTRMFLRPSVSAHTLLTRIPKGVLIVANHQSRLDLFVLFSLLPPRTFFRLIPIYGIIAPQYMNIWWKRVALTCFGLFPLSQRSTDAAAALLRLLDLTAAGKTLLLFPEGKVITDDTHTVPGVGAGYLVQKRALSILPVYLSGFRNVSLVSLLTRKHRAQVVYGELLSSAYFTRRDPYECSVSMVEYIYRLA